MLWFAFIFVSLQSLRQQRNHSFELVGCCDLLLFSYLCKVLDNAKLTPCQAITLWFAFIFVSLQSLRQRRDDYANIDTSCDLLLFSYLCKVLDNQITGTKTRHRLWFAFIFVSLQSLRQLSRNKNTRFDSCDLLLFSYLCKVLDNLVARRYFQGQVVICFYFRIFAKS